MPKVRYGAVECEVSVGESVLDGLLRAGVPIPNACRAGACGSCMLRTLVGEIPAKAQLGLKPTWKDRAYFLACVCHPTSDMEVAAVGDDVEVAARIVDTGFIGGNVLRVRIGLDAPFAFRGGQYLTLLRPDRVARSYSIASLPEDGYIELHVRLLPGGRMSDWLRNVRSGQSVRVLGPSGDCFYSGDDRDQPLLLVGTGTGLAPLYAILRDALRADHQGPIHLFHGAVREDGLYMQAELQAMAEAHPNLCYTPTLLALDGRIDEVVARQGPAKNSRAYLCGDPTVVNALRKQLYLGGLPLSNIQADAFLPAAAPAARSLGRTPG
jgi:CDP-4-dehydro-6-deoxyglucose reductase, E3